MLAEFESADALVSAAQTLRQSGITGLDAYTPFPLKALDQALALPPSRVPRIVLLSALTGAVLGYGIQWWCAAIDFPLDVGGRPLHSGPAFIPIAFESAVLFGGFAAFIAVFALARMPLLWRPVFTVPGFERASIDRFFLSIENGDDALAERLASLGALRVERVEAS